ncbi:MAG: hypothetical protein RJB60_953, partial [Pseudomonadota bacterium]
MQKFDVWAARCHLDEDWEFISYVLRNGLAVVHPDCRPEPNVFNNYPVHCPVLASLANTAIADEIREGLVAEPAEGLLDQCIWQHPLSVVPKSGGKARVVHDFSAPEGGCLNDRIDFLKTRLPQHDAVFAALKPGMYMAKLDLRAFFRHVPLDPADWCLVGFSWNGRKLVDTRLNFGQRNAPEVSDRFGQVIERYLRENLNGIPCQGIFRVSDDWLLLATRLLDCEMLWQLAITTLEEFGFVVNRLPEKSIPPCQRIIWCGLEYDSVEMTVRLPSEKVEKALELVRHFRVAATATRTELDSLFGYLSFCASVVFGGRAFLHGLRAVRYRSDGTTRPSLWRFSIDDEMRLDMAWWDEYLVNHNGDIRIPIVAMTETAPRHKGSIDTRGGEGGLGSFVEGAFV